MTHRTLIEAEIARHRAAVDALPDSLLAALDRLIELSAGAVRAGGKLIFFGNGGSAADAQHLATEFVVRYVSDRRALPALALTTDTSLLTAAANDLGFEQVFARQVEGLGRPGDIAIGISTSGRSPNVLAALSTARAMGLTAAGMSGGTGGDMVGLADPLLIAPTAETARIQELHILMGHILCAGVERAVIDGPSGAGT